MTNRHRICWRYRDGTGEVYRGVWFGGPQEDAEAVVTEQNSLDSLVEYWLEIRERETVDG